MTAWTNLLTASQLTSGSAWDLLSNPRLGGAGLVVNDGITVELGATDVEVEVDDMQIEVEIQVGGIEVEVPDHPIEIEVATAAIEVEVNP